MERNGLYHECARNVAFFYDRGSAGLPCSPCQEDGGGCYYELCRFGNDCKHRECPRLHPATLLMLVHAFKSLDIPTNAAYELTACWADQHVWDFPPDEYHFDSQEAMMHKSTFLPKEGCATDNEQHKFAFSSHQSETKSHDWHKTALLDLDKWFRDHPQYKRFRWSRKDLFDWLKPQAEHSDRPLNANDHRKAREAHLKLQRRSNKR